MTKVVISESFLEGLCLQRRKGKSCACHCVFVIIIYFFLEKHHLTSMLFFEFSNKKIILFMCLLPSHFDIAHYYLLKVNQEEGFIDHGF